MTPIQLEWTSHSVAETQELAAQIGHLTDCGIAVALVGELGSGKTAFVQGLARGLLVPERYRITSPSFTIINEYPGRCRLFHIDLYRIETMPELQELGLEDLLHGDGVAAIEWAERLQQDLPDEHLFVHLKILGDETRQILIRASGPNSEILLQKMEP